MKDDIYVFLDFEFNCPEQKGSSKREIISMAAVFRYSDGSPLTSFHSIVRPSKYLQISSRTTRLTGITQSDINKSRYFDKVVLSFLDLVDCFSPKKYFVWGNADQIEVQKSARYSKADKRMVEISKQFYDLQTDIMKELKLPNPCNLERAADIYGIDFVHTFSAIEDAECLADIYFAYKRQDYDEERLIEYRKFYEARCIKGKYKLTCNNIKMAEEKIVTLTNSLSEYEEDSETYRKLCNKIKDTEEYLELQKATAIELAPQLKEAELFLKECDCV